MLKWNLWCIHFVQLCFGAGYTQLVVYTFLGACPATAQTFLSAPSPHVGVGGHADHADADAGASQAAAAAAATAMQIASETAAAPNFGR